MKKPNNRPIVDPMAYLLIEDDGLKSSNSVKVQVRELKGTWMEHYPKLLVGKGRTLTTAMKDLHKQTDKHFLVFMEGVGLPVSPEEIDYMKTPEFTKKVVESTY